MKTVSPFATRTLRLAACLLLSTLNSQLSTALAQGTAFTYQGRLNDGANPAAGIYDLRFTIYDSTNLPGTIVAGPLTNAATGVTNGLFTATLDFGASPFTGPDRWLDISVRTNGSGAFTTLNPRQKLTPTPYSITAKYLADVVANNTVGVGPFSTIGGGYGNAAPGSDSTVGGGGGNTSGGLYGTIGGGGFNVTANSGATIGGGYANTNNGYMAVIAGGWQNFSSGIFATVSGGSSNVSSGFGSTVSGGIQNTNIGDGAAIAGGFQNVASGSYATVGGGYVNVANGSDSTIGGGTNNNNAGDQATIGGGGVNTIQSNNFGSTISGGIRNFIQSNTPISVIAGGSNNVIQANANGAFLGGGLDNAIQNGAAFSTISGGSSNTIHAYVYNGTVAGGTLNTIQRSLPDETINGDGSFSAIGGGRSNIITGAIEAVIYGGEGNVINGGRATLSVIGGGYANRANDYAATIAGGTYNASGSYGSVGGGSENEASGNFATVSGGVLNHASGASSTVGGGYMNQATNNYSTASGGQNNVAGGAYSFAAGQQAQALHPGSFVWSDSQNAAFASTAGDQFDIRAQGGVGIGTGSPQAQFNVNGTARIDATTAPYSEGLTLNFPTDMPGSGYGGIDFHNAARGGAYSASTIKWGIYYNYAPEFGVGGNGFSFVQNNVNTRLYISTNGNVGIGTLSPTNKLHVAGGVSATVFVTTSDRNAKENFARVSSLDVLEKVAALPITRWTFKEMPGQEHLGPMAQDFHAAFNLGSGDTGIATVDEEGVALAAIQGLNQKLTEELKRRDAENTELRQKNVSMEKRLEALEKRFANLN